MHIVHRLTPSASCAASYLPCDPAYPDDRLAGYLEDASTPILLTEPAHQQRAENLSPPGCRVLQVAEARPGLDRGAHAELPTVTPDDAAYIIFTSGSTGRPKGCSLPHRGLADMLAWLVEQYSLGAALTNCLLLPCR